MSDQEMRGDSTRYSLASGYPYSNYYYDDDYYYPSYGGEW